MSLKSILAVDDDEDVRQLYRRIFSSQSHKFSLDVASNGKEAIEHVSTKPCDCLILDLGMSGVNGFDVLRHLRSTAEFKMLPVLVVTGSKKVNDGVRALELGADDYINKPFSTPILEAKVARVCKRSDEIASINSGFEARKAGILEVGPFKLDRFNRRVYVSGSEVILSEKEYELFYCILRRVPGLTRWSVIHNEVWPRHSLVNGKQSDTLQVTLSHLKSKLGAQASAMIVVQKGQGLRIEV